MEERTAVLIARLEAPMDVYTDLMQESLNLIRDQAALISKLKRDNIKLGGEPPLNEPLKAGWEWSVSRGCWQHRTSYLHPVRARVHPNGWWEAWDDTRGTLLQYGSKHDDVNKSMAAANERMGNR